MGSCFHVFFIVRFPNFQTFFARFDKRVRWNAFWGCSTKTKNACKHSFFELNFSLVKLVDKNVGKLGTVATLCAQSLTQCMCVLVRLIKNDIEKAEVVVVTDNSTCGTKWNDADG